MTPIKTPEYAVYFEKKGVEAIRRHLAERSYSRIFLLTDSNTVRDCLPVLLESIPEATEWTLITIPAGEEYKHIHTCLEVWKALSSGGADRKSLLINLGGGVVTDLGGFVAATYMRGVPFIHIPTTLLSMVDASVGGKTGVDLDSLKNQIGAIVQPKLVWVYREFLKSLPEREVRSGFAEMLKHGLIRDAAYWKTLATAGVPTTESQHIYHSVSLKNEVVLADPTEQHLRKILNFGHTLGHAIESHFLKAADLPTLLHGEAIAIGMILEAFLSLEACGLPLSDCDAIKKVFLSVYGRPEIPDAAIAPIVTLLAHDKKNAHGKVLFTLLKQVGVAVYDCEVPMDRMGSALAYYRE